MGRYKSMFQCATKLVAWSGIRRALPRRPAPKPRLKNEASLHAYPFSVSPPSDPGPRCGFG